MVECNNLLLATKMIGLLYNKKYKKHNWIPPHTLHGMVLDSGVTVLNFEFGRHAYLSTLYSEKKKTGPIFSEQKFEALYYRMYRGYMYVHLVTFMDFLWGEANLRRSFQALLGGGLCASMYT